MEQGLERLTTDALTAATGLSAGGIFRHFNSKDDILLQLMENIHASLVTAFAELRDSPGPALDRLRTRLRQHFLQAERRRGIGFLTTNWALYADNPVLVRKAQEAADVLLNGVADILRQGQAEGSVRPDINVEVAAELFRSMAHGHVGLWTLRGRSFPVFASFDDLWELYRQAIGSPEAQRDKSQGFHAVPSMTLPNGRA